MLSIADNKAQTNTDSVVLTNSDSSINKRLSQKQDTLIELSNIDSISKKPLIDTNWVINSNSFSSHSFSWEVLKRNKYFDFKSKPIVIQGATVKIFKDKNYIFYLLVFLLLMFAVLRQSFQKYFNDLFRVFFRTTLKQKQIREQLMQTPLPSLILNGFFVMSAGLYITFLIEYFNANPVNSFWLLFFYCCIGLSIAYMVKFLGLKIAGWVFGIKEAVNSYIFIVFIINKMIGILLLPILILLAFSDGDIFSISITVSWCLLGCLLLYRIILTYSVIRNQIKVNPFHFLLYFCAFEMAPILLVYRGLLLFFDVTA